MGKGTILSEIGEGQYSITIDKNMTAIVAEIAVQNERIVEIEQLILEAADGLNDAKTAMNAAESAFNDAVDAYSTEPSDADRDAVADAQAVLDEAKAAYAADPSEVNRWALEAAQQALDEATEAYSKLGRTDANLKAVVEAQKALAEAAGAYHSLKQWIDNLKLQKLESEKAIERLEAIDPVEFADVWCADFTLEMTGEVALLEVPGEETHVQIRPGHDAGNEWLASVDGQMTPKFAIKPNSWMYNVAMMPGWQKWMPGYRLATITAVDHDANTCSLAFDDIRSTVQGLSVNHLDAVNGVEFSYMTCDSRVFAVDDEVVVEFVIQEPAPSFEEHAKRWEAENMRVIGFRENPKPCAGGRGFVCFPANDTALNGWGSPFKDSEGEPINGGLGTANAVDDRYSVLYYDENTASWQHLHGSALESMDIQYGNMDWQGGANGDDLVTWWGSGMRYNTAVWLSASGNQLGGTYRGTVLYYGRLHDEPLAGVDPLYTFAYAALHGPDQDNGRAGYKGHQYTPFTFGDGVVGACVQELAGRKYIILLTEDEHVHDTPAEADRVTYEFFVTVIDAETRQQVATATLDANSEFGHWIARGAVYWDAVTQKTKYEQTYGGDRGSYWLFNGSGNRAVAVLYSADEWEPFRSSSNKHRPVQQWHKYYFDVSLSGDVGAEILSASITKSVLAASGSIAHTTSGYGTDGAQCIPDGNPPQDNHATSSYTLSTTAKHFDFDGDLEVEAEIQVSATSAHQIDEETSIGQQEGCYIQVTTTSSCSSGKSITMTVRGASVFSDSSSMISSAASVRQTDDQWASWTLNESGDNYAGEPYFAELDIRTGHCVILADKGTSSHTSSGSWDHFAGQNVSGSKSSSYSATYTVKLVNALQNQSWSGPHGASSSSKTFASDDYNEYVGKVTCPNIQSTNDSEQLTDIARGCFQIYSHGGVSSYLNIGGAKKQALALAQTYNWIYSDDIIGSGPYGPTDMTPGVVNAFADGETLEGLTGVSSDRPRFGPIWPCWFGV